MEVKKQLKIYAALVLVLAMITAINVFIPVHTKIDLRQPMPHSKPVLAIILFTMMLVVYGTIGLIGFLLAKRLSWPGIYNEKTDKKQLLKKPMQIGLVLGVALTVIEKISIRLLAFQELPRPPFPYSILGSLGAGIGEEILFRLFLVSLWAFILGFLFKKYVNQEILNWIAIIIAALAFGALHVPSIMFVHGVGSPTELQTVLIIELFLLNGVVGVVAGKEYIEQGFVAAVGIHFWTDIVWRVIYGLI